MHAPFGIVRKRPNPRDDARSRVNLADGGVGIAVDDRALMKGDHVRMIRRVRPSAMRLVAVVVAGAVGVGIVGCAADGTDNAEEITITPGDFRIEVSANEVGGIGAFRFETSDWIDGHTRPPRSFDVAT